MIKKFMILAYFIPATSLAAVGISIELTPIKGPYYHVIVVNRSPTQQTVSGNFCLDPIGGFSFHIEGEDSKVYTMRSLLNQKCNTDRAYTLEPYEFAGRILHINEFQAYYDLPKGAYKVKAIFCLKTKDCLISNEIGILVPQI